MNNTPTVVEDCAKSLFQLPTLRSLKDVVQLLVTPKKAIQIIIHTIHNAKDSIIVICFVLLETIDCLQEQLQLPIVQIQKIKKELSRILGVYEQDAARPATLSQQQAKELAAKIATSEAWIRASVDEIFDFVRWIGSVMKWLTKMLVTRALDSYRHVIVLGSRIAGVQRFGSMCQTLYDAIQEATHHRHPQAKTTDLPSHYKYVNSLEDDHLTAVILSYREKEDPAPLSNTLRKKIHRMMHFQVSLKPFDAVVRLPDPDLECKPHRNTSPQSTSENSLKQTASAGVRYASTPRSIPVSPISRSRVQAAFSNFSDDVLYQARDQLRRERAETLTGEPQPAIPTFNVQDTHPDIYLSCGFHCATKIGSGLYRTSRGSASIKPNMYVYFQMEVCATETISKKLQTDSMPTNGICIGLSTREMPLTTLVGTWKESIGFYSSGHIIVGSKWQNYVSTNAQYGPGSTVGVLVYINSKDVIITEEGVETVKVFVEFSVDGKCVTQPTASTNIPGLSSKDMPSFHIPLGAAIFPTLTLYSTETQVLSRFASSDLNINMLETAPSTAIAAPNDVYALDGVKIRNCS